MPSKLLKIYITESEHELLREAAAGSELSAFVREKVGLQPLKRGGSRPGAGRPKKVAAEEAVEP